MSKKKEIKESTSTQIKAVLNTEQQEKYASMSQQQPKQAAKTE